MHEFDLERYLTVRSAYGATLTSQGRLAFLLDLTGVTQVWTLSEPQSWPTQRTFYDEPIAFVSASPTREELIFGMDEGGNERMQLFLLNFDGEIQPLTATEDAKHRWGGWSTNGDRFAFASNRREEAVFDVYVQKRTESGDEARMIFEGDGWFSVGSWSPEDDALILREAHSNFDHDVYVLDVESSARTHLTGDTENTRYRSVQWGPTGEWIYLVTDGGEDTLYLARMHPETGELETVRDGGEWNIDGVVVDDVSRCVVYSRNVDGHTELTLGELLSDGSIRDLEMPDLPGSIAGGVSFAPDGSSFGLSASGRTINTNCYVVDVDALRNGQSDDPHEAVTRWTNASTANIPRETFIEAELVHYETFDQREIPAYVSFPPEIPEGGAPLILDIHGGPESQRRPSFSGLRQYFLSRGYALFEPNIRGSTGYGRSYTHLDDVEKRMDSIRDIEAALDWLEANETVDEDRIVAKGGSYGGFVVLAALTEYPERFAAGIDVVGIANFVTFLENTGSWRRELREAEYGSLEDDREFLESISPINNITAIEAPLFVLHGANDPRVPVSEAKQIAEKAAEQGVPVETLIFEDEGHGISKLENQIEAYTEIVAFLDEHV